MISKAAAVIVTYHPNLKKLTRLVHKIESQLDHVFVIDNGSPMPIEACLKGAGTNVMLIKLGDNLGIARAQNEGINRARVLGLDFVVLFDQDSNPHLDALPSLFNAMFLLLKQGGRVACVGPSYIDKRHNNSSTFIRVEGLSLVRPSCDYQQDIIPVDHLIASGSVISLKTLDFVGGMKEELFIDYVDLEWCERAKYLGYQTYGVCAAQMEHALGDEPISFMGTSYPARSPLRHYYMFRNAMWIYRQDYVRWNWKVVDGLRLLRKYVFYTLFAKPRSKHFWMMTKGMWHGLIGKMGRYSP